MRLEQCGRVRLRCAAVLSWQMTVLQEVLGAWRRLFLGILMASLWVLRWQRRQLLLQRLLRCSMHAGHSLRRLGR